MQVVKSKIFENSRLPIVIEANGEVDLDAYANESKAEIDDLLGEHAAVLFRGFRVQDLKHFNKIGEAFAERAAEYQYRSTPRTWIHGNVYTATEYPSSEEIPLHSENSYQREWPLRLLLYCQTPALVGGETPVADLRMVTAMLSPRLRERLAVHGVTYIRHFHPNIDLSWMTAFQTRNRAQVEKFCQAQGIAIEWGDDGVLRTAQTCRGLARHPVSGEEVFFNQAHLFHPSSLPNEVRGPLIASVGAERMPRNAMLGDGSAFSIDELEEIRSAFRHAAVVFSWRAGDVLLLDNMQTAHGRRPFSGARQVYAMLLQPHAESLDLSDSSPPRDAPDVRGPT